MLAAGLCLGVPGLLAQSATPSSGQPSSSTPAQAPAQRPSGGDNPFPGDAPQAPAPGGAKPDSKDAKPKPASDNPFPGEDPNAPIIPVEPASGVGSGAGTGRGADSAADPAGAARRDADPDGDPVRSPDPLGHSANDDGFSSSRAGVSQAPVEEDSDAKPGKPIKNKSREQTIKEDIDVGGFYLEKKNWKAAQGRFSSAFALDAENPDSVWGLAEAERHLQLYKEAAEHYRLFLSYEPEGRRGREARKALEEVEAAQALGTSASKTAISGTSPPK